MTREELQFWNSCRLGSSVLSVNALQVPLPVHEMVTIADGRLGHAFVSGETAQEKLDRWARNRASATQ